MDPWQAASNQPVPLAPEPENHQEPKEKNVAAIIAIVLGAVLLLAIGIAAGYFLAANFSQKNGKADNVDALTPKAEELAYEATSSADIAGKQEISWLPMEAAPSLGVLKAESQGGTVEQAGSTYLVGKVLSGKYQGGDLILMEAYPDGPAFYPGHFRFVRQALN